MDAVNKLFCLIGMPGTVKGSTRGKERHFLPAYAKVEMPPSSQKHCILQGSKNRYGCCIILFDQGQWEEQSYDNYYYSVITTWTPLK